MKDIWSKHKVISLILLGVFVFSAYKTYGYFADTSGETRYVISAVGKGSIISTVSGSGQVSAWRQIELKPKASGEITHLGAKSGQFVGAGQLIAQIDSRDAALSLANAKLNLQKALEINSSNSGGLAKNSEDSLIDIDKTFLDLPTIMDGLNSLLNDYRSSVYKINLPNDPARASYEKAKTSYYQSLAVYQKTLSNYQKLSRPTNDSSILASTEETYAMLQVLAQTVKDSNNYLNLTYNGLEENSRTGSLVTDRANVNTWAQTINANLTAISANLNTVKNTSLDIRSQELAVQQQENNYADYFLRAPFAGVVQINVSQGDSVSSGASLGSIITNRKIATVSLNEVDITKVKIGQKATLTFDAVSDLSISGVVTEIDIVGTVSQGVVSYNVKIAFDTEDSRIKSGMSVGADIAVDVRQDIVVVPSGAIKASGDTYYVESFGGAVEVTGRRGVTSIQLPEKIIVTTGQSDDTNTEILSGLKEGDKIITQTLASSVTTKSAASLTSLLSPSRQRPATSDRSPSGRPAF